MKKLLGIAVFSSAIIIGCLETDSDNMRVSNLPDGFSASCYWENQQSVQGECGKNDESCIESHYLEVGERAGLGYGCSYVGTSSEVVSSSSEAVISSEVVSSSSEAVISSEVVSSSSETAISSSLSTSETFTDSRDNKSYKYVTIGTQVWMAENLAYLPQVDAVADGSEDVASGKYYYVYDYIPIGANETEEIANAKLDSNYQTYGVLYNWYAAMDGATSSTLAPSGVEGICPSGWHLPSDAEWTILNDYVDANNGSDGIGNSLRATTGWKAGTTSTDQFGFSALPAGRRYYAVGFDRRGSFGRWWSASDYSSTNAYNRRLSYYNGYFYQSNYNKSNGFSVRCLEDTP